MDENLEAAKYDVFISYSRRDMGSVQPAAIARMACSNLELPSTNEATIRKIIMPRIPTTMERLN